MPVEDIRPLKAGMRERYKALRRAMTPQEKARADHAIAQRVASLWQYRRCQTVLTYVSTDIEVDTHAIIRRALQDGKRVAVPRCVPGTRNMEFYLIRDLQELSPGTFGVLEPPPNPKFLLPRETDGLCLVPALCYDWKGFRLGYGKGYYDRYLAGFRGRLVGLCYSSCVRPRLPHGRFDRPVELLVTDRFLRRTEDAKKSLVQTRGKNKT